MNYYLSEAVKYYVKTEEMKLFGAQEYLQTKREKYVTTDNMKCKQGIFFKMFSKCDKKHVTQ